MIPQQRRRRKTEKVRIGWKEWAGLPELGIPDIKVKVDTGARTSSLHAFDISGFRRGGKLKVRFSVHPLQKRKDIVRNCVADVVDRRVVSDSGGHREKRYVICTVISMGHLKWPAEITLSNRDSMNFRMLLGRTAMHSHFWIDPDAAYLFGKAPRNP